MWGHRADRVSGQYDGLLLDLHIDHDRYGSRSDPSINDTLHYPTEVDRSLNETVTDKIRKYHSDYNNNPPTSISFMTTVVSTSVCLRTVNLCVFCFYNLIGKLTAFLQLQEFSIRKQPVDFFTLSAWRSSDI